MKCASAWFGWYWIAAVALVYLLFASRGTIIFRAKKIGLAAYVPHAALAIAAANLVLACL